MSLQIRNLKLNESNKQTLNMLNSSTGGITICKYKIQLDTLLNGNYYIIDNNGNKVTNRDLSFINLTINIENIPLLKKINLITTFVSYPHDIITLATLVIDDNSSNIQIIHHNKNNDTLNSNYYFNFLDINNNNIIVDDIKNNIITVLC